MILKINEEFLKIENVRQFVFDETNTEIEIADKTKARISSAYKKLNELLEKQIPIYGVTTGFGDSCSRVISPEQSEELQRNLISYLSCGTGPFISKAAAKATFVIRLQSLCRGYSGVSLELIERMKLFLERDWIPAIPCEGSLGASGDLIPLAYVARILQGQGDLITSKGVTSAEKVLKEARVEGYTLKAKEGIALVNGTSVMAGLSLVNLNHGRFLLNLAALCSSWACMALNGKVEAFSVLVNEKAKKHSGQARVAKRIRTYLVSENYQSKRGQEVTVANGHTVEVVQDRYSLRCVPQILGPIIETIEQGWNWLELEINSASDNPLISEEGTLEMGGNFYGGYLTHSMDYLKICLANLADLYDRQLAFIIDDKSNRGLTPNLAGWNSIPENERFLHHGLKGLHQSVSALTSDIMSQSIPNSIFSRSSECHNQDKVSLGMTAAVRCSQMIETLYTIQAMYLICLTQALDLRGIEIKDEGARLIYDKVRRLVPMIQKDMALGEKIVEVSLMLKDLSTSFERKLSLL
jgi:phenylalanine ammonia-lyase